MIVPNPENITSNILDDKALYKGGRSPWPCFIEGVTKHRVLKGTQQATQE